jgi:hypothetical protein
VTFSQFNDPVTARRFFQAKHADRRRGTRPRTGDMRACPQCSVAEIEFNERYRVDGETIPAWFCESPRCGYVEFVRARNLKKLIKRASHLSRTKKSD